MIKHVLYTLPFRLRGGFTTTRSRRDEDGRGREKGCDSEVSALLTTRWGGGVEKKGPGSGRRPRGGEGLGTVWGTGATVERRGAAGTGPDSACASGCVRSHETGEAEALTGRPRLQFRAVVKFNLKLNSN
jgi:hypothetical protein